MEHEVVNTSGLKPVGRAVLLQPYGVEEKTAGGILLPDMVRKKDQMAEQRAVVVEVGPSAWEEERTPRACIGDRVLFSKYAGYVAIGPADDREYRVVNDSDIFMVITKEKANG